MLWGLFMRKKKKPTLHERLDDAIEESRACRALILALIDRFDSLEKDVQLCEVESLGLRNRLLKRIEELQAEAEKPRDYEVVSQVREKRTD